MGNETFALAFRSARLYETDLVANTLREAGIASYRRTDRGGGEFAMPLSPVDIPGTFWRVYIAQADLDRAREIIAALPIGHTPEPVRSTARQWLLFRLSLLAAGLFYVTCKLWHLGR
jgi:hypothetical protein